MKLENRVNLLETDMKHVKKRLNILERNIINELISIKTNMFSIKRWIISSIVLFIILFLSVIG